MRNIGRHSLSRILLFVLIAAPIIVAQSEQSVESVKASDVKSQIVEAVKLDVCLNYELLEYSGIEIDDCDGEVNEIAPVCWYFIDKLVVNYELAGKMIENKTFHDIANVFTLCVQSEMMMPNVREMQRQTISDRKKSNVRSQ